VARLGPYDTQQLTRASLELSARRHGRVSVLAGIAVALGIGALLLAPRLDAPRDGGRSATLARQNAALRADLGRLRAELELERAARGQLEAQVAGLGGELAEANQKLDFLAARGVRAPDRP
jgi:hypothetical protein